MKAARQKREQEIPVVPLWFQIGSWLMCALAFGLALILVLP